MVGHLHPRFGVLSLATIGIQVWYGIVEFNVPLDTLVISETGYPV